MYVGHGLKPQKVEKHIAKLAPALAAGEEVIAVVSCNNMRPLADRVLITTQRLIASHSSDGKVLWATSHQDLLDVIPNGKKKTFAVHTSDGHEAVFKIVRPEDQGPLVEHLNAHRTTPLAGLGVPDAAREDIIRRASTAAAQAKADQRAQAVAAAEAEKAAKAQEKADLRAKEQADAAAIQAARVAPPTVAQSEAIAQGFPERHRHHVEPLLTFIAAARDAAERGDVIAEERAIWDGEQQAKKAGVFSGKSLKWFRARVLEAGRQGEIRRGVELLGVVGKSLVLMSDRVVQRGQAHVLDADVKASVHVDGHILQSTRPSLGTMAIGSILPGSALLIGLARPKTETKDTRTAQFVLVHPQWRIVESLDPDNAHRVTGLAAQINAIAESKQRTQSATPGATEQPASSTSLAEELTKLASLRDAGVLTDEEFATAKARLLA